MRIPDDPSIPDDPKKPPGGPDAVGDPIAPTPVDGQTRLICDDELIGSCELLLTRDRFKLDMLTEAKGWDGVGQAIGLGTVGLLGCDAWAESTVGLLLVCGDEELIGGKTLQTQII